MASATIDCPGCGRRVARRKFACPICWNRLPLEMQRKLNSRHQRDDITRLLIEGDGRAWFRCHKPKSVVTPEVKPSREMWVALGGDPKVWDAEQRKRA